MIPVSYTHLDVYKRQDKIAAAKSTILNSVIGLLIAIFATAITIFVAGVV